MLAAVPERADDLAVAVAELSGLLLDGDSLEQTLQRVVDLAVRSMVGCTGRRGPAPGLNPPDRSGRLSTQPRGAPSPAGRQASRAVGAPVGRAPAAGRAGTAALRHP